MDAEVQVMDSPFNCANVFAMVVAPSNILVLKNVLGALTQDASLKTIVVQLLRSIVGQEIR